ncbi:cobalt-precorrin-6A reductase [Leucothrix sargassi]|nr:cobalt-precorrin-6A reductase [Leucothrix sargassi]
MKVLILGGTSDAKAIALALHTQGLHVIYSIAGIVRQPDLPCDVISGGFTKRGGLTRYIRENNITALVNATHPFAQKMSLAAERSAQQTGVLFWRYQRPDWVATEKDDWHFFDDWGNLLKQLSPYERVFLSQGQLSESMLAALIMHRKDAQHFLHRTAVIPSHRTPEWMAWVHGIGPFSLKNEQALLTEYDIQALVSKHSGGQLPAKMIAAQQLQIPVFLLQRPTSSNKAVEVSDTQVLINTVLDACKHE